jgi:hypothetical protein
VEAAVNERSDNISGVVFSAEGSKKKSFGSPAALPVDGCFETVSINDRYRSKAAVLNAE